MNKLKQVVAIIKSGCISGQDTVFIDETLSNIIASSVSLEDANDILNYINLQLANNPVSPEVRLALEILYDSLQERRSGS